MTKNKIIRAKQINLKEVSSVLIVAPYDVEDFILSTPAITALKEALPPEGRLTAVVSRAALGLAGHVKGIDNIVPAGGPGEILKAITLNHEVLVNFDPDHTSSMLVSLFSRAKAKVAYALKKETRIHNALHNLKLHTIDAPEHKTIKFLNLVRFIGANSYDFSHKLTLCDGDKKYALEFLKKNEITSKDILIGIHPTLRNESKRWAINKFHQLVDNLVEKFNARIVVFYHEDEKDRLEEFMHVIHNKAITADTTDYMKLAALSVYFTCFICNETDFMHLLAPFTNEIVIWGSSDYETNKPAGSNYEVMQAQDGSADSVPVSRVTEHINKYLSQSNP
jgi:ADP-heptose:LPS heptosyltransferase